MRRLASSLIVSAFVFAAFGASAGGFREDEIYCEEAVARLAKCCPSFDTRAIECSYYNNSTTCNPDVQYPAIDEPTSKCILALDCGSMVDSGVCDRARGVAARISMTGGGSDSVVATVGLCP